MFNQDDVQFKILIEAAQALKEIEHLRTDAVTLQQVFDEVQAKVDQTADKMGVSFMTMEKQFKDVIDTAEKFRKELAEADPGLAAQTLANNPMVAMLSGVQSPFSTITDATGWTEVNAIQREILKGMIEEMKAAERIAKEMNKQSQEEDEIAEKRRESLDLAQQELQAVEKEGEALVSQLKNYGQVSRTVQETASYLRSFAGTQQGQGILTKFLGDYQQSKDVVGRIDAIKVAIKSLSKETGASFSQAGQLIKEQFSQIPRITNQVNSAVSQLGKSFESTGQKAQSTFQKVLTSMNAVRIALGAIIAMLLFQATQAVTSFFGEAVKQARQLEETMYRLGNAERSLSLEGIEVSMKGLQDGIEKIQKLLPIFSKEDLTQLVATLAVSTKQLGFTEEELIQLAQTIALLNIQSEKTEDLATTRSHVVSALLSSNSRGIAELGVSFNEFAMKQKAVELGFIKQGDSLEGLSDDMKAQIKLQLLVEGANVDNAESLERLNEYLETNTAKIQANKSAWQDFLTVVGQGFNNLIPNVAPAIEELQKAVEIGNISKLFGKQRGEDSTGFAWMDSAIWFKLGTGIKLTTKEYERLKAVLSTLEDDEILKIFPDPSAIKDRFTRELVQSLVEVKDTATETKDGLDTLNEIDTTKAQEALEDLLKSLEKLGERIEKEEKDFQTKLTRFDEDALEDRARLIEDYNLNVAQTLRQFALRRKELEDNYRKRELDDEAKFQEQLRQLREKFLYNLEDALRERDARQVLRLIDQYNMEKQALINENALKKKEDAERQQGELQDLKAQEAERLRVMAEEHALRLQRQDEDSALRRSRMLEDHAQEMADLRAQKEELLKEAADKIAQEYGLNEEGAKALYELLNKYYGGDGILEKLVADGYRGMLEQSAGFLSQLQQLVAYQQGVMAAMSAPMSPYQQYVQGEHNATAQSPMQQYLQGEKNYTPRRPRRRLATGGQFLATRPTTLDVGEGGMPELVSVIPLSKLLGGSLGVNGSGGSGGLNGSITVDVNLSPDLEGRIIESAMDNVGEVIGKVNRSK